MADTTVVRFSPSEPFDSDKLNTIVDAISEIKKSIPTFGSSTVTKYTPVTYAGNVRSDKAAGAANSTQSLSVTLPDGIFDAAPYITVTPRINNTNIKDGVVNYYISDVTKSSFKINYSVNTSFKSSKGITFDWIAVYIKPNV